MEIEAESDAVPGSAAAPIVVACIDAKLPLPKQRGGASHMCVVKAFDKRQRINEEQKAKTVQHYLKKPTMTYSALGKWCQEEFKLENAPSEGAICKWLKPEKRKALIAMLETETSGAKLSSKSNYQPDHPEVELKGFKMSHTNVVNLHNK